MNDLRERTAWLTCIGIIVLLLIPYSIVNHLPLHRHTIPFMPWENRIPFLPWTFLIYISVFVQDAVIIRRIPAAQLRKTILLAAGMILIGLAFFVAFPIEYPRWLYQNNNGLVILFRNADGPGNCFPSLHVAVSMLLASYYSFIEKSLLKKVLMWLWALAIILSVLTTKQHYVIDIIGGIILSIPFIIILKRQH